MRSAPQFWIVSHLDRRVEHVHVHVDNGSTQNKLGQQLVDEKVGLVASCQQLFGCQGGQTLFQLIYLTVYPDLNFYYICREQLSVMPDKVKKYENGKKKLNSQRGVGVVNEIQ